MTKTLAEIKAEVEEFPGIYSAVIWADRRVYVNFIGYDRAFAGCRNLKVYFDKKAGWRVEGVKGTMDPEFARNARSFMAHVGLVSASGGALI